MKPRTCSLNAVGICKCSTAWKIFRGEAGSSHNAIDVWLVGDTVGTYDNETEGKLVKFKVGASGDDILEKLVRDPIGASEKVPCDI